MEVNELDVVRLTDERKVTILEKFTDNDFLVDDQEDAPFFVTREEIADVVWRFKHESSKKIASA